MTIAILVPVLGRSHQIEPLLKSIADNTTLPYRVVFICSPKDQTTEVCRRTDAQTIVTTWKPARADFARKINLAYEQTSDEWLFQAATDLTFHQNWDVHAMQIAEKRLAGVIGTNDSGNPGVKRGQHSTHTFFSREYIETYGGTVDNTGTVFCELYDHQWTDNEFVRTAMVRRKWAFSLHSVVEHNHPHWGKGEMDATYDKALRATDSDRELFTQRMMVIDPNSPAARRARHLAERRARMHARRHR